MFYVYLIRNEAGKIYVGSTRDLRRRFREHNSNRSVATSGHAWNLVYYEAFAQEADAREREKKLKQHGYSLRHLKARLKQSLGKV